MTRIVVGVDGDEQSRGALAWAATEAQRRGATLVVVHAWNVPAVAYGTSLVPFAPPLHESGAYLAASKAAVDRMLAEVDLSEIDVDVQLVQGHAGDALVLAGRGASMIVLGARTRGALAELVLGSTIKHVHRHADVPVVVIPPGAAQQTVRAAA